MPPIILTPGTFNPPATPVEHAGIYLFAKQPDVTLNRRPQQSSRSRVAGFPPLPVLPPNIGSIVRDYFTGNCRITIGDDFPPADQSISLVGCRYVPDGTYLLTGPNGVFFVAPWPRVSAPIELGEVFMARYKVPGIDNPESTEPFAACAVSVNYAVEIAGAEDGADYEVSVRNVAGETIYGPAGTFTHFLSGNFSSSAASEEFDTLLNLEFMLNRNGDDVDFIRMQLRFTGTAVSDATSAGDPLASREDATTIVPSPDSLPEIMYGGQVIIPVITGPATPLNGYERWCSFTQGRLTLL